MPPFRPHPTDPNRVVIEDQEGVQDLYERLIDLIDGETPLTVITAITEVMAAMVGNVAINKPDAEKVLRHLSKDMMRSIDRNWDAIQIARKEHGAIFMPRGNA
jgi:hypothetical protein